jgi:Flp pilus assembly pilin Flp
MAKKNLKKGQTSMEYMLILGLVVGVIVIFGKGIKGNIGKLVDSVFNKAGEGVDRSSASE